MDLRGDNFNSKGALYNIDLDFFNGPLDLLLHLVNSEEVSVQDVSMKRVTEQYLDIISRSEKLDLNRLTEYLVVAATLVSIKSESILPNQKLEEQTEEVEIRDGAFYEELREKLRRYELTKQRANKLRESAQLGVDTFIREDKKFSPNNSEDKFLAQDSSSLASSFMYLLKRIGDGVNTLKIRMESVSVISYMMKIIDDLKVAKSLVKDSGSFKSLITRYLFLDGSEKKEISKQKFQGVVIGTFMAVLELCRRGVIEVSQKRDDEDIKVNLREGFSVDLEGEEERLLSNVTQIERGVEEDKKAILVNGS